LEDILRKVIIAEISPQITEQLPLVTAYQRTKYFTISLPETVEELFV
jgi:hypothetical protein